MDEKIWNIINNQIESLESCKTHAGKLNIINNIIELKIKLINKSNINLYWDLRQYLFFNIKANEEKNYNYYKFKIDNINYILSLVSLNEQITLLDYFIKNLKLDGFESESNLFNVKLKKLQIINQFKKGICHYPKGFLYISSFNLITLLITLFLVFIFYMLILLPAPFPSWSLFKIEYVHYHDNYLINHIINLLSFKFNLNDNIKVVPIGIKGVVIEIFGILIFWLIAVNYLFKEIISKIKFE